MSGISGIGAVNLALQLIAAELSRIKDKVQRKSTDPRDKLTDTEIDGFIHTLAHRLNFLDHATDDLIGTTSKRPSLDYQSTDAWAKEVRKLVKSLRSEPISAANMVRLALVVDDNEELSADHGRNVLNVFAEMLKKIDQQVRDERYKIKVDKTDADKAA